MGKNFKKFMAILLSVSTVATNVILYHGSTGIIEPKYGEGTKDNDYGVGFYCTENIEMAFQ